MRADSHIRLYNSRIGSRVQYNHAGFIKVALHHAETGFWCGVIVVSLRGMAMSTDADISALSIDALAEACNDETGSIIGEMPAISGFASN